VAESISNTINDQLATRAAQTPAEEGVSEASITSPEAATTGINMQHFFVSLELYI
jgi:hypothetical protein